MTQTTDAMRAGALILAVADRDLPQLVRLMHETLADDRDGGILGLMIAVATVAIESAKQVNGERWREVMVTALNTLEIDGIDLDGDDDG